MSRPGRSNLLAAYFRPQSYVTFWTLCCASANACYTIVRIRMQDEERVEDVPAEASGPAIVIEDTNGVVRGQTAVEASNTDDPVIHHFDDDSSSTKSDAKDEVKQSASAKSSGSILGRINTLIATDIDNIIESR